MGRRKQMPGWRRALLVGALAWAGLTGPIGTVARAQDGGEEDIERWWGVVGAAICGTEVRLIRVAPVIGMNPFALAAGISGCVLTVIDVIAT